MPLQLYTFTTDMASKQIYLHYSTPPRCITQPSPSLSKETSTMGCMKPPSPFSHLRKVQRCNHGTQQDAIETSGNSPSFGYDEDTAIPWGRKSVDFLVGDRNFGDVSQVVTVVMFFFFVTIYYKLYVTIKYMCAYQ